MLLIRDATNLSTEKKLPGNFLRREVIDFGLFSTVRLGKSRRPDDLVCALWQVC